MNQSIGRAVAREYDRRRRQAETDRLNRRQVVYQKYPALVRIDRGIAAANADLLIEAIAPDRPKTAAGQRSALEQERLAYMNRHAIEPDFDQLHPVCPLCGDTGMQRQQRCSCYQQIVMPLLIDQANLRNLAGIHFNQFDLSLFSPLVNQEQFKSERSPRDQMVGLKDAAVRYAADFDQAASPNLLFFGRPGTGKTFLMACIANAVIEAGHSVLYLSAPQLFEIMTEHRTLLATFNPDEVRMEKLTMLHDSILQSDLLLIDDLGTEPPVARRYSDLLAILDSRQQPSLHTIISSNVQPMDLRQIYDERLLSRLMGQFTLYRFYGEDVRLQLNIRRRKDKNGAAETSGPPG